MGVLRSLFLVAVLAGGLGLAGFGWTMYQNERADVTNAVEVEGTVQSTDVEEIGSPSDPESSVEYEPVVRYTYSYQGESYRSDSVYPGPEKRFGLREDARAVADQFSPGRTVTVHVNQETPTRAYLIEETGGNLLPLFSMGFGVLIALAMLRGLGEQLLGVASGG